MKAEHIPAVKTKYEITIYQPTHVQLMTSIKLLHVSASRDGSVGIATRYGLDGPRIESRWGRVFPHPSRLALEPTQPPVRWVTGLSRGLKRPGRGVNHPLPSSAEVNERVELYFYSPSGFRGLFYGKLYLFPLHVSAQQGHP